MSRPVIGIISNIHTINDDYEVQAAGIINLTAIRDVTGAAPVMLPADPDLISVADVLDICDGILFTGGRPNVHPEEYGEAATEAHGAFDRARDRLALPLIREAVQVGCPVFAICRGFQEMNVAFGGTLDPEIRDLAGRDNHRMPPDGTLDEKFAMRHVVTLTSDGPFQRILGATEVMTNSLHGQGIRTSGERVIIDGRAPDKTPEAIYIAEAAGFALGVQWHPEWNAADDPVSRPLFSAFGDAVQAWSVGKSMQVKRSA